MIIGDILMWVVTGSRYAAAGISPAAVFYLLLLHHHPGIYIKGISLNVTARAAGAS